MQLLYKTKNFWFLFEKLVKFSTTLLKSKQIKTDVYFTTAF